MARTTHPASSSCGRTGELFMHRLVLVSFAGCVALALAFPARADAQTPGAPPAQAAAPQPPDAGAEPRSLFDDTWNQFQIAGRATSIDGDPARFQRYQDVRDGLLFTNA